MQLYGQLPHNPVVFAACDSEYFIDHAVPFTLSARKAGHEVHIHITNPSRQALALAEQLEELPITVSYDKANLSHYNRLERRAYYACLRFLVLPFVLQNASKVLVLDIDCLVMKPFDFPTTDTAYFPRRNESSTNMKVAAGAVYFSIEGYDVAVEVSRLLRGKKMAWYVDQVALSTTFDKVEKERITEFDNTFMDWNFTNESIIWTGKGPRKYRNKTYLQAKKSFGNLAQSYFS